MVAGPARRLSEKSIPDRSTSGPVIFLSVGEPSGDLHGAAVARALKTRIAGVRLIGLGGPGMAAEGVELLADLHELAVMGFVEVLSRLPFFLRLRRMVFGALERERVDLVIPVDYPGFNLRLARHARRVGIPVLYYIAPQVWAWHASRAADLARDADRIAVILPFEEDFLRAHGANVEFVGHPLLDRPAPDGDREGWVKDLGLLPENRVLALFPGSRAQEIERHLGIFSAASELVQKRNPEVRVVVGGATAIPDKAYAASPYPVSRAPDLLLRHATAALVKSGTTTLEAALAEVPFVVAYRMNRLTYQLARRVVRVPHIALANLVAGRRVVPELVQDEVTADAMARALEPLLDESDPERRAVVSGLREVRSALKRGGAGPRVADIAAELLEIA
ncbi:MAG: lipid-A-disaccharide synthase [Gemmatimonas sp.]|nr:lipid-A-disaccharide synthase [Gemmatimonas sp.]